MGQPKGQLWRIPAGVAFVDALAQGLLARHAGDPLALTDQLILLPTRRACRSLRQAFLRQSGGQALLLPRLLPLGDLDADELWLSAGLTLTPAVSPRVRQMELARLIKKSQPELPVPSCLTLAQALARLMDDFTLEGANPDALQTLVQESELAEHWAITLEYLQPLLHDWQNQLRQLELSDPATRKIALLQAQAAHWQSAPPAHGVMIAGSTGALPALAALIGTVLQLPRGEVVLPAFPDARESAPWWDGVDETHPLAEQKSLLSQLGITPEKVQLWPVQGHAPTQRLALLHHALLPASCSALWAATKLTADAGLSYCPCSSEQEEAATIALALRACLQTPEKTALLVTPDRALARRVAGLLARWDIVVDDSAGTPLAKTENALFLRLLLAYSLKPNAHRLLAVLKHPMFTLAESMGVARARVQILEQTLLRDRLPPGGNLSVLLSRSNAQPELLSWLHKLQDELAPLHTALQTQSLTLPQLLRPLISCAQALANTDVQKGEVRLWRGQAGVSLSEWLSELLTAGSTLPAFASTESLSLLETLMQDVVVRSGFGEHPRLSILGPMEARLQQADFVILAGLNEGIWPAEPAPDPWLSRPMRKHLGLKTPEARLGQEAHDFYSLAAAPEVLLTRAERQGGTPTIPARWLSRLLTVLGTDFMQSGTQWKNWLGQLEQVEPVRISPPEPRPPVAARPTTLYVTDLELLQKDPYSIYAKHILKLRPLPTLEVESDAAARGDFVHKVLQRFITAYPLVLPANPLGTFLHIGEQTLVDMGLTDQRALWWPRFERMAAQFLAMEQQQRADGFRPVGQECTGVLQRPAGPVIKAKADRIDQHQRDHSLAILDYKTGGLPTAKEAKNALSLQLPLEGAIAQSQAANDGFKGIAAHTVTRLQIWPLGSQAKAGTAVEFRSDVGIQAAISQALERADALFAAYAQESQPYLCEPDPFNLPRFNDYAHLARKAEWGTSDAEGADEQEEDA